MKIRWSIAINFIFIICISGLYFFRDFIFVNSNGQIEYLKDIIGNDYADNVPNYTHSRMVRFFGSWNIQTIIDFKWYMTMAFTVVFGIVTSLGLYITKTKRIAFYSMSIYIICFVVAYLISLIAYPVGRQIVGLLHSPIPYLILLIAGFIETRIDKNYD